MGFIPAQRPTMGIVPHELVPCSAIATTVGMAMTLTSGKLAKCTGTTKPEFICMQKNASAVAAGTPVPVIRVTENLILETTLSAAGNSLVPGSKVTIATDGLRVTATTESGVAEIVSMEGTASGSKVLVHF